MSFIVTTDYELQKLPPPNLPLAPPQYSSQYTEQFNNVLRLYFNRLTNILGQLMASGNYVPVTFPGMETDAFGRLRISQPYTLFDSQNRYAADNQFDVATTGTGTTTFLSNEAALQMQSGRHFCSVCSQAERTRYAWQGCLPYDSFLA